MKLAILRGCLHPPLPGLPYGSLVSSFNIANSLISSKAFSVVDFYDEDYQAAEERREADCVVRQLIFPPGGRLPNNYDVIYLSGGHFQYSSFSQRPNGNVPIIAETGTTHLPEQWSSLLISIVQNHIRKYDGLIFKSNRARNVFIETFDSWKKHFKLHAPAQHRVIPNGVDLKKNVFDPRKRTEFRSRFKISDDAILFLAYSRISPSSKVDYESLIHIWKGIAKTNPNAILIISGAIITRPDYRYYPERLLDIARGLGVYRNIRVIANPHDLWQQAHSYLMSGCDAFIHTTKGLEETTSNVVLEALAHSLPVFASNWAGMPDLIEDGRNGFLVDSWASNVPSSLSGSIFSRDSMYFNREIEKYITIDNKRLSSLIKAVSMNNCYLNELRRHARRSVESTFDIEKTSLDRINFFRELADCAKRIVGKPKNAPPLVDIATLLHHMSSHTITDDTLVYRSPTNEINGKNYFTSRLSENLGHHILEILLPQETMSIADLRKRLMRSSGEIAGMDLNHTICELCRFDILRIGQIPND